MIVIADSGPLRYFLVIEAATPPLVRAWMEKLPEWMTVRSPRTAPPELSPLLGEGEREAIALAEELAAGILSLQMAGWQSQISLSASPCRLSRRRPTRVCFSSQRLFFGPLL
jgi:hypothetical protein